MSSASASQKLQKKVHRPRNVIHLLQCRRHQLHKKGLTRSLNHCVGLSGVARTQMCYLLLWICANASAATFLRDRSASSIHALQRCVPSAFVLSALRASHFENMFRTNESLQAMHLHWPVDIFAHPLQKRRLGCVQAYFVNSHSALLSLHLEHSWTFGRTNDAHNLRTRLFECSRASFESSSLGFFSWHFRHSGFSTFLLMQSLDLPCLEDFLESGLPASIHSLSVKLPLLKCLPHPPRHKRFSSQSLHTRRNL
jgi:hypothetical protein